MPGGTRSTATSCWLMISEHSEHARYVVVAGCMTQPENTGALEPEPFEGPFLNGNFCLHRCPGGFDLFNLLCIDSLGRIRGETKGYACVHFVAFLLIATSPFSLEITLFLINFNKIRIFGD